MAMVGEKSQRGKDKVVFGPFCLLVAERLLEQAGLKLT